MLAGFVQHTDFDLALLNQFFDRLHLLFIGLHRGVPVVLRGGMHGGFEVVGQGVPLFHADQDMSGGMIALHPSHPIGGHFVPFQTRYGADIPLGRINGAQLQRHVSFGW